MSWIPVEEQLPEIKEGRIFSDIVLGVRGDHYKLVELWQNKYGVIQWFGDWEPTHWQPLPAFPVEGHDPVCEYCGGSGIEMKDHDKCPVLCRCQV